MRVWGGSAWNHFVSLALEYMGDLRGKSVLELGFHDGQMSREFARRGATVTALEILERPVTEHPGVTFLRYDGNLDSVEGQYDFVFTKSVLVVTDIDAMLPAIKRKLSTGGRVVFIENGLGGPFSRIARRIRRPGKSLAHISYFTDAHIQKITQQFPAEVRFNTFPPVYLVCGHTAMPDRPLPQRLGRLSL